MWSPFQGKAEAGAMIQLVMVLASTESRIQPLGIRPNFSADGGRGDRLLVLLAVLARVRGAGFERRIAAFLLVLVLLRLLLFSVAAHLTLRHSDLQTFDR